MLLCDMARREIWCGDPDIGLTCLIRGHVRTLSQHAATATASDTPAMDDG
jgi:hypothetical protein